MGGLTQLLKYLPVLSIPILPTRGVIIMSGDAPKSRPKVPEGKSRFLTTTQNEIKPGAYVGYTTTWESFQKEVPYSTPKKP